MLRLKKYLYLIFVNLLVLGLVSCTPFQNMPFKEGGSSPIIDQNDNQMGGESGFLGVVVDNYQVGSIEECEELDSRNQAATIDPENNPLWAPTQVSRGSGVNHFRDCLGNLLDSNLNFVKNFELVLEYRLTNPGEEVADPVQIEIPGGVTIFNPTLNHSLFYYLDYFSNNNGFLRTVFACYGNGQEEIMAYENSDLHYLQIAKRNPSTNLVEIQTEEVVMSVEQDTTSGVVFHASNANSGENFELRTDGNFVQIIVAPDGTTNSIVLDSECHWTSLSL